MRERLRTAAPLVSLAELGRDRAGDRAGDRRDLSSASTARSSLRERGAVHRRAAAPLPPVALWYTEAPRAVAAAGGAAGLWASLADLLGLWHEMRRGSHNGDTEHCTIHMSHHTRACRITRVFYACRRARALVLRQAAAPGQHPRRARRAALALRRPRAARRGDLHGGPLSSCRRAARA